MTSLHGCPAKQPAALLGLPRKLPSNAVEVIARAIRHAWAMICDDPEKHLAPPAPGNPEEDIYSDALKELLVGMLTNPDESVPGFSDQIFSDVLRGANVARYDLTSINKQPDLFVRVAANDPSQLGSYYGLFIEAKVIRPSKGVANYTDEGTQRFVDGEYAWIMEDAMMIAYQVPPGQPIKKLGDRLAKSTTLAALEVDGKLLRVKPTASICAVSVHVRGWHHQDGTAPGDIRVWHVWDLNVPAGKGKLSGV